MAALFDPIQIKDVVLKNRLVVSPMCQYSSDDGFINDWHVVHLGSRAVGGAALVFTEATAVRPEGRISPHDLGIWKDDHIPGLKRVTNFIEGQKSVPGIQLAHAGRKASHHRPWDGGKALDKAEGAWQTFAPSPIPFKEDEPVPIELKVGDIERVLDDFKAAAKRALEAGFKVIEIHAAHGYLLNEFLSPLANHRSDDYGGSFENRIRIVLEVVDAVKQAWPDRLPLFIRLSCTDWVEGGWTEADSVKLAMILKGRGVDVIDCSSGGVSALQKIPVAPLYQVPFSKTIRHDAGILTAAVGLITTVQQCADLLANDSCDLVVMARELLRDPYFPLHAAAALGMDTEWPSQYQRAKR